MTKPVYVVVERNLIDPTIPEIIHGCYGSKVLAEHMAEEFENSDRRKRRVLVSVPPYYIIDEFSIYKYGVAYGVYECDDKVRQAWRRKTLKADRDRGGLV